MTQPSSFVHAITLEEYRANEPKPIQICAIANKSRKCISGALDSVRFGSSPNDDRLFGPHWKRRNAAEIKRTEDRQAAIRQGNFDAAHDPGHLALHKARWGPGGSERKMWAVKREHFRREYPELDPDPETAVAALHFGRDSHLTEAVAVYLPGGLVALQPPG